MKPIHRFRGSRLTVIAIVAIAAAVLLSSPNTQTSGRTATPSADVRATAIAPSALTPHGVGPPNRSTGGRMASSGAERAGGNSRTASPTAIENGVLTPSSRTASSTALSAIRAPARGAIYDPVATSGRSASGSVYYMQEGADITQACFTGVSGSCTGYAGFASIYLDVVVQKTPYPTGFELNGLTNTGDWFQSMILLNWCSSTGGFTVGDEAFNSSGGSVYPEFGGGAGCFGNMTIAAGDDIQLGLFIYTSGAYDGDVCFSAFDETNPNHGYVNCIAQPDPGPTPASNYFEFGSSNGFFTGPMTEVITTAGACENFGTLPEIQYGLTQGAYVTHFTPWSDEWSPAAGVGCFSTTSSSWWTMGEGDNGTQIVDASSASNWGPRWEGFQNTTSLPQYSTWWTFDSDYTLPTPQASHDSMDVAEYDQVSFFESAEPEHIDTNSLYADWLYTSAIMGSCAAGGPEQILTCYPANNPGTGSVEFEMGEQGGYALASPVFFFNVYSDPAASRPTTSAATVDVGENVTLTAIHSGGSGTFDIAWWGLPSGCTSENLTILTCVPSGPGSYSNIFFTAVDSNGEEVTSPLASLNVNQRLVVPLPSASLSSGAIDVDQTAAFSAEPTGGSGEYTRYQWTGLPTGCTGSEHSLSCTPTASGTFLVAVAVTDSNGAEVTSRILIFSVQTDPAISTFAAAPGTANLGTQVTLHLDVLGGRAPLSYSYFGLPDGCSTANLSTLACSPSAAGTFPIEVKVRDANGFVVTGNVTLAVLPAPAGTSGPEADIVFGALGAALVVLVVLGVLLVRQRPRRNRPPPTRPG
jgi:hypothetical protein